jgi:translation initiation factor IF-2
MSEVKRLSKVAREFNISLNTIVDFLKTKGITLEVNPNAKVDADAYKLLIGEFKGDQDVKEQARQANIGKEKRETISLKDAAKEQQEQQEAEQEDIIIKNIHAAAEVIKPEVKKDFKVNVIGKIDLDAGKKKPVPPVAPPKEEIKEPVAEVKEVTEPEIKVTTTEPVSVKEVEKPAPVEIETIKAKSETLAGPTVVGKIVLPVERDRTKKPTTPVNNDDASKKKRKRIKKVNVEEQARQDQKKNFNKGKPAEKKTERTEEQIQKEIKETLQRLSGQGKSKSVKLRKAKREAIAQRTAEEFEKAEQEKSVLKITEFVTVGDLSKMMNVQPTQVISACMSLGIFASINQRLDAETLSVIAEEFGYKIQFVTIDSEEEAQEEEDTPESMVTRPPIVTVMGHVDHGKTSLLDYIRKSNVIAGEAGGITQHIGAYGVTLDDGRKITFLDTPGHEAFTAMRARGAQVTDIAIIVIAADDNVMPQTREAINHAQAANVPMVFAINKIDKPDAKPEKIKEELANMNILVEDWGGKYQCQEISAKKGLNVEQLLEKVLLEAELLELKANPDKNASGTVIESELDKGRGYVSTILVENGTLKIGDILVAGAIWGRIKAMQNERGAKVDEAGPATAVSVLGMTGAPGAGDKFKVYDDERDAKEIAVKRQQLIREQGLRTHKHITLDEIGRRLAIGDFKELNIIVKGDVDGSVEALSESLEKLSTQEIAVNIIHKAVGAISESDVLLASASDAIIIGFQVRPSASARKLAETEEIDIRLYSIIYQAIEEIKSAMEGMLSPDIEEKITGTAEIREAFKITKVGTVAGCYVLDGKINRNNNVRVIRDGIVVYTGQLGSLKRFKDDVKEVATGYECGLNIDKFNDIKVGDIVEAYEQVEVSRTL